MKTKRNNIKILCWVSIINYLLIFFIPFCLALLKLRSYKMKIDKDKKEMGKYAMKIMVFMIFLFT